MGAGMVAFFGSRLQMGIETVLDTVGFDEAIKDADVIFTGEGKIDSQSLRGKVVIGVARRAVKQAKPVVAIVGGADYDVDAAYGEGVTAIFPINRLPQDFSVLKDTPRRTCLHGGERAAHHAHGGDVRREMKPILAITMATRRASGRRYPSKPSPRARSMATAGRSSWARRS